MLTVLASEQFFISKSNHINIWTINWIDDHLKIIPSEVASQAILPLWSDKKSLEVTVELKTLVKLGYFQSDPASPEFSTRQGEAENSINPVKAVQCIPNNLRNCHLSWFTWLSPSTGPLPGSGSRNNDQRSGSIWPTLTTADQNKTNAGKKARKQQFSPSIRLNCASHFWIGGGATMFWLHRGGRVISLKM